MKWKIDPDFIFPHSTEHFLWSTLCRHSAAPFLPWQMIWLDFHKRHTSNLHLRLSPPASSKWFLCTFSLSSASFPFYWSVVSVYPFGPHPDNKTSTIRERHWFDRDAFCICSSQYCECDLEGIIYTCNSCCTLSSIPDILLYARGICKGSVDSGKTDRLIMIHASIFIRVSSCLSASLLLRGEQQTCCC